MLRCVNQATLERCARDEAYLARYHRALRDARCVPEAGAAAGEAPLVAYFCAEYGFHESFPIYSGGLGVLAGDYCKAASDERANFVAVGLLYEQGYFTQTVDNDGVQHAEYRERDPRDLPVEPVRDASRRVAEGQRAHRRRAMWSHASGRRRSDACRCTCSTPTARRTRRPIATSPTASTAAMSRRACARK